MAKAAREAGLLIDSDVAGNMYLTLKGREPAKGTFLIGSHVDTVPQGGNFDGAAGVIAGIAILTAWKRAGFVPSGDVAVIVIRAEESTWFPYSYIGSKAALGLLPPAALDIPRADTGRTLGAAYGGARFQSGSRRARSRRGGRPRTCAAMSSCISNKDRC